MLEAAAANKLAAVVEHIWGPPLWAQLHWVVVGRACLPLPGFTRCACSCLVGHPAASTCATQQQWICLQQQQISLQQLLSAVKGCPASRALTAPLHVLMRSVLPAKLC
jgi:hypothetical protein